ncbi:PPK2 family polyphosphate kinase [Xylophilus sp.]|uniref:PPK2 family polyphosphate kinase n=1 Tax=Xylophilus sp. TaxID=2653893 RepID=UPI0013B6F068|nr:PPK2 family polyphosphate kinase [Xylophilus sp.]KAF1048190.1 MAG: Polyphosphate:AMP/ADP phosphotransferase [Xylophilus sp.]
MAVHRHFPPTAPADERLAAWQPGGRRALSLDDFDPAARPYSTGAKLSDRAAVDKLAEEIDALQNLFHADRRYKLLVVLQGLDTSGKDGTIRGVFGRTSPLGVRAVGWRAPSEEERAHDFLWRIHKQVPGAGEVVVFNRSHYEDVLVPVVAGSIDDATRQRRLAQINDFERMLAENGTVIRKFMLHIGFEEQRQRLQARLDDPAKNWKFSPEDLTVRHQWTEYRHAYEALLAATHTSWAPWTIVPADSKTHRNLMIATLVRDTLAALNLRPPPPDPALKGVRVEA